MTSAVKHLRNRSILFVDPGKRVCGVAHWRGGVFRAARLIDVESSPPRRRLFTTQAGLYMPDHMVIEFPVIYPHGAGKDEDNNDLLEVAASAGACAGACDSVAYVQPRQWKGTMPKLLHQRERILPEMSEAMHSAVAKAPKALQHNMIDAIGLGLWWMRTHPLTP